MLVIKDFRESKMAWFDTVATGDTFQSEGQIYLKINEDVAWNFNADMLEPFDGSMLVIPLQTELRIIS